MIERTPFDTPDRCHPVPPSLLLLPAVLLLTALACEGTVPPPTTPSPSNKKVLLIGLDGIRTDILAQTHTPHIDALIAEGTFSDAAQTRMPTVSGPGWSSMVTGVWADKHRVEGNDFSNNDYATYPDFLTRLEQVNPGFTTVMVYVWPPLGTTASGGPMISDAVDVKRLVNGDSLGYRAADSLAASAAAAHLAGEAVDAAFVYLGNTDVVGHETSSLAPAYGAAVERADAHVGTVLAGLKQRPTYADEDWLILMSTDHGRRDDGGHGQPSALERRIFYLASGRSAVRGTPAHPPHIVDVAVTALSHLGVPLDSSWDLDGQAVGLSE